MNKEIGEFIMVIFTIILMIIGFGLYSKTSDIKKNECISKGGKVIESYLGFYEKCVIGEIE